MMFLCVLPFLAFGPALGLRRSSRTSNDLRSASEGFGNRATALWNKYVQQVEGRYSRYGGIQEACKPKMYPHTGGYRGTIVLFHGFTACPQQFDDLHPRLTQQGFVVLTPLNPGHGMVQKGEKDQREDQWDEMAENESQYHSFGKEIHSIMQAAGGERVIFGISLGGTIASYVGKLGRYDRRFIAVPLIQMAGLVDPLVAVASQCNCVSKLPVGWGEPCEVERSSGRAGICSFNVDIAGAARDFGEGHLRSVRSWDKPDDGQLQMVFVDNDPAVNPQKVQQLARRFGIEYSNNFCGFDSTIAHSFLSPYDNPSENKYWLEEVTGYVADYLVSGKSMPQKGEVAGKPRCDVKCTAESCKYTRKG